MEETVHTGLNLRVCEGTAVFTNALRQKRFIPARMASQMGFLGLPQRGERLKPFLTRITPLGLTLWKCFKNISQILNILNELTNVTVKIN